MTSFADDLIAERFAAVTNHVDDSDWADVLRRAGETAPPARARRLLRPRRALVLAFAVVALALAVGVTLAATVGGFSHWLTGSPGRPASPAEQATFGAANSRSYAGFPPGTKLRRLIETRVGGAVYRLYGFRSGDQLCLRLIAQGIGGGPAMSCVPRIALEHAHAPAQVAQVDWSFGTGKLPPGKRLVAPMASASFGFAADSVSRIELDSGGNHQRAIVANNAFLAIRQHPPLGSRVRHVFAFDTQGHRLPVPVAAAPFGFAPLHRLNPNQPAPGPTKVEHVLTRWTIRWLNRHEPRGLSLAAAHIPATSIVGYHLSRERFARVIQPDPLSNVRIVILQVGKRHNLCVDTVVGDSGGGGCSVLSHGPLDAGLSQAFGGDQFSLLSGLASDQIARLVLFLSDGERWPVPLKNNAFAIQVPRAQYPVNLVAYDAQDRVVAVNPWSGF
jgi:hypothetical protein